MHVLLRGGAKTSRRVLCFWTWLRERHRRNRTFAPIPAIDATLLRRGHWRVTSTPSPRCREKYPPARHRRDRSDPRRRLARRQRRDHRPHVLRRLGLRPGPRLVHARDRGPGVSHLPVPVERLCFAVSFVSLPLFVLGPLRSVLCRGDFAPAPVARSLRPSHPLGTPRRHRRGLTASRTRAGGVLRGVRAEDPGALGACEPEKTPAPTPDPEGRVCNGGPYDGRRCQNHGFCQQPDPTQPDIDACDDCKCITRKDSDGAGRTSSGAAFLLFSSWGFWGLG